MYQELRFLSDEGLSLYARDYPASPAEPGLMPLVCLHGLTRNSRDFEDFAAKAASLGHRVLVPDTRGRGRSAHDPAPERYHPFVYAGDVLALLRVAGVARAGFVGTSMGGLVTLVVAKVASEVVGGALLNDIGPELSPVGLARIASYVGKGSPIASWEDARAYVKRTNGVAFPSYGDAEWDAFARRVFDEDPAGVPRLAYDPAIAKPFAAEDGPSAHTAAAWETFTALVARAPTTLVRGELSDILDAPLAEAMKTRAPDLHVATVHGIGHAPTLVEPEAWDAFLAWRARLASA